MLNYHKTQADKKRHELGLSYADVAALTGLSKPTVRAALLARRPVKLSTWQIIARALQCDMPEDVAARVLDSIATDAAEGVLHVTYTVTRRPLPEHISRCERCLRPNGYVCKKCGGTGVHFCLECGDTGHPCGKCNGIGTTKARSRFDTEAAGWVCGEKATVYADDNGNWRTRRIDVAICDQCAEKLQTAVEPAE